MRLRIEADDAWLLVAAVFTAAPLFLVTYPPFTDLPEHVAVMASLRHFWDPAWRIQEHYVIVGRSQYALYHLAGALLTFVVGDAETANKLLLAATAFALPFAMRALLRALGREPRLALFAAPLFWSRPLVVGFLPYVASLPALLAVLALATRQADSPTRRRGAALAVFALLLFYLHASAYALLAVIVVPLGLIDAWRAHRAVALGTLRSPRSRGGCSAA